MDLSDAVSELRRAIAQILDDQKMRGVDLQAMQGSLTYFLGNVNTIALNQKQTLPIDRQAEIDALLKQLNAEANKAFERLDFLIRNPPPIYTGTRPKRPTEPLLLATPPGNHPLPKPVSDPKPTEKLVEIPEEDERAANATNPFVVDSEQKEFDEKKLLDALYSKIHSEFDKILNNPELIKRQRSTKNSDRDADESVEPFDENAEKIQVEISSNQPMDLVETGRKYDPVVQRPKFEMRFDGFRLSTFSGDYTEWISFRDEFIQLVHTNPDVTDVVKFQQLKTHLKGIALDAINGFKLCAADYKSAWATLVQRYDNDHRIVTEYIKKFFQLPLLNQNPSNAELLRMVNTTNQLIRVLPSFGYDVSSWDPIIMYCLLARLDGKHVGKWNSQIKMRQRVPLSEMIEFLEIEAAEIVAPTSDRPRFTAAVQKHKNKAANKAGKKAHVMLAVNDGSKPTQLKKCAQCGRDHLTYTCPTFLALSVQDRIKKIKGTKYCLKCLNKHGKDATCNFRPCKHCNRDHNDILCLQFENTKKEPENKPAPSDE